MKRCAGFSTTELMLMVALVTTMAIIFRSRLWWPVARLTTQVVNAVAKEAV